ncbi:MAG: hypothetical protein HPKKFMNG_02347 [Planctomycetes bacterium]|nr:hypothetical protein [Planctomycetota bacterium]MCQ3950584.1 hypothetical protein [Planctomycetota bacterium]GIK53732.1 MAG: hypothetical protein BroJett014_27050 [Planctomycetota bacterium]HRJ78554.1 hypothetical protein [Planctomycetota bacterium]
MDALTTQYGLLDSFTVIEEFTLFVLAKPQIRLDEKTITDFIYKDFGYEVFSFKEDLQGDWKALKARYKVK